MCYTDDDISSSPAWKYARSLTSNSINQVRESSLSPSSSLMVPYVRQPYLTLGVMPYTQIEVDGSILAADRVTGRAAERQLVAKWHSRGSSSVSGQPTISEYVQSNRERAELTMPLARPSDQTTSIVSSSRSLDKGDVSDSNDDDSGYMADCSDNATSPRSSSPDDSRLSSASNPSNCQAANTSNQQDYDSSSSDDDHHHNDSHEDDEPIGSDEKGSSGPTTGSSDFPNPPLGSHAKDEFIRTGIIRRSTR
ncbi:hypothetical protein F4808DRAFT_101025 [Astrocystis sublimbata]|nr:hypothetical protein F4808DRAFT_101025 [Astrocystis sublimbata]